MTSKLGNGLGGCLRLGLGGVLLMAVSACTHETITTSLKFDNGQWKFGDLQGVTRCQFCDPKEPREKCVCNDPAYRKTADCKEFAKLDPPIPPICTGSSKVLKDTPTDQIELRSVQFNPICPIIRRPDGTMYETSWCFCAPGESPPPGKTCRY